MNRGQTEIAKNLLEVALETGLNFSYTADNKSILLYRDRQSLFTSTLYLDSYTDYETLILKYDQIILEAYNLIKK